MKNEYLVEPFTYQMQFSFRNTHDPQQDAYKYKVAIGIEKLRINLSPSKNQELLHLQQSLEAHSYQVEIKRFRPLVRLQNFIDARKQMGRLPPEVDKKRRAVVRDWFRLVLWYVRLRKAARATGRFVDDAKEDARSYYPESLLAIHLRYQMHRGKTVYSGRHGINLVKQTDLRDADNLKKHMRNSSR